MVANTDPIFQDVIVGDDEGQTFANGDGTTKKTIYTAGADGGLIDSIIVTSSSTAQEVLELYINNGTSDFLVGAVIIPTLAGTDGVVPAVNLLDSTQMPWLQAGGGVTLTALRLLKVAAKAAVTDNTVTVVAKGGDY